jgi:hypothetical protein
MRVAGSTNIRRQLVNELAADSVRPEQIQSDLDAFHDLYALLLSKGYSDSAAQQVAQEMVAGLQPAAQKTTRFAGTQGLPLPQAD